MHIGNLRTALFEYLIAKHEDGDFILRIEDTDQERLVEGAVDIIYDTLKEVGLTHDEGPDVGGDFGPYVQSERLPMYKKYADELVDLGGAHYCFCGEEEIEKQRKEAESLGISFLNMMIHVNTSLLKRQENVSQMARNMSYVRPSSIVAKPILMMKYMDVSKWITVS